ncbi:hypothetical protein SAMN02745194_04031 [Roseomonas rosea]|uniref:Uncharacterized protein n=1 Tax=Muricoccus roseus TaxID=198092 RepID=A0A1M6P890_9PROT|nr:hypothetical protein [Roseomonas rosea]SHK04191.1 hypothetical protein SAMN02745194_04031 [Roseomonas rosea]
MASSQDVPDPIPDMGIASMRLLVLEMTVAAVAARLPQNDLQEVVSMLVFVAKSSEAARDLDEPPADAPGLTDASHYATQMLDRIAQSRRSDRTDGRH